MHKRPLFISRPFHQRTVDSRLSWMKKQKMQSDLSNVFKWPSSQRQVSLTPFRTDVHTCQKAVAGHCWQHLLPGKQWAVAQQVAPGCCRRTQKDCRRIRLGFDLCSVAEAMDPLCSSIAMTVDASGFQEGPESLNESLAGLKRRKWFSTFSGSLSDGICD